MAAKISASEALMNCRASCHICPHQSRPLLADLKVLDSRVWIQQERVGRENLLSTFSYLLSTFANGLLSPLAKVERTGTEQPASPLGTARFITPRDAKYDARS
jgi:hypothetical protein